MESSVNHDLLSIDLFADKQLPMFLEAGMNCQRWNRSRTAYRPAGEPIDPSHYGVEIIDTDRIAKEFVIAHHYSQSYPAARCRVGLWRQAHNRVPELVGVAVFSVGMQPAAMRKHARVEPSAGVELGRFVLLDDVPANGETWFLARAFRLLVQAKPQVKAVLSYSDPMPRRTAAGDMVMPGHVGTIYQAFNGRHVGRSKASTLVLSADGQVVPRRGLSKIRNGERGDAHSVARLVELGAPAPRSCECPREYVRRALAEGPFRRVRHPGNLAYVWPVGAGRRKTLAGFPVALAYPKRVET